MSHVIYKSEVVNKKPVHRTSSFIKRVLSSELSPLVTRRFTDVVQKKPELIKLIIKLQARVRGRIARRHFQQRYRNFSEISSNIYFRVKTEAH